MKPARIIPGRDGRHRFTHNLAALLNRKRATREMRLIPDSAIIRFTFSNWARYREYEGEKFYCEEESLVWVDSQYGLACVVCAAPTKKIKDRRYNRHAPYLPRTYSLLALAFGTGLVRDGRRHDEACACLCRRCIRTAFKMSRRVYSPADRYSRLVGLDSIGLNNAILHLATLVEHLRRTAKRGGSVEREIYKGKWPCYGLTKFDRSIEDMWDDRDTEGPALTEETWNEPRQ